MQINCVLSDAAKIAANLDMYRNFFRCARVAQAPSALRSVEERPFRAALRSPSIPVILTDRERPASELQSGTESEREWKDPDVASCTILHQGVLSKLFHARVAQPPSAVRLQ